MRKTLLYATAVLNLGSPLWASPPRPRAAGTPKVFALVPRTVGLPFYAEVEAGCKAEARKIDAECLFIGPSQANMREQANIIHELIKHGVSGIGIAPDDPINFDVAKKMAQAKSIPVVAFDSGFSRRYATTYIGTNNLEAGKLAGKEFRTALPNGGLYAVITGSPGTDNLNDRIEGFRSVIGDEFTEISGSPYPCNGDSIIAIQILLKILKNNPNLSGIFFTGGWPMFVPEAYKRVMDSRKDSLQSGRLVIVSFDKNDSQLGLLKAGLATALVGQRPREMGAKSLDVLNMLSAKDRAPLVVYTGIDLVTKDNVDEFLPPQFP